MSTASPDEEFIIDRTESQMVVAAGFSGQGFKFAPAVAVLVAELVLGNSTADHEPFSYARFGAGPLSVAMGRDDEPAATARSSR